MEIRNAGQNQSTGDFLCSAFNLFKEENGILLPTSYISQSFPIILTSVSSLTPNFSKTTS
ncbi:hypothetical protein DXD09_06890 [Ligilactobacillus ruminis]|uniref:Uncharacterized protein n=1 Tax=Ligilactobacillus ruminis TaxID=1623 RepID=A0A8B2Z2X6_9LACO|nr:hypothetical protein DXD09_06890 [Ligilactobacillus ruminis]